MVFCVFSRCISSPNPVPHRRRPRSPPWWTSACPSTAPRPSPPPPPPPPSSSAPWGPSRPRTPPSRTSAPTRPPPTRPCATRSGRGPPPGAWTTAWPGTTAPTGRRPTPTPGRTPASSACSGAASRAPPRRAPPCPACPPSLAPSGAIPRCAPAPAQSLALETPSENAPSTSPPPPPPAHRASPKATSQVREQNEKFRTNCMNRVSWAGGRLSSLIQFEARGQSVHCIGNSAARRRARLTRCPVRVRCVRQVQLEVFNRGPLTLLPGAHASSARPAAALFPAPTFCSLSPRASGAVAAVERPGSKVLQGIIDRRARQQAAVCALRATHPLPPAAVSSALCVWTDAEH